MNKKPDTMVDFAEKFVEHQEKEFAKALIDPSVADVLLKSPETAPLSKISAMLEGVLFVQANIADRLFEIEKLLAKEESKWVWKTSQISQQVFVVAQSFWVRSALCLGLSPCTR